MNWPVDSLIPQKHPFVFIDQVIDFKETEVNTVFEIKENSPFLNGSIFEEAGLIENIAQTAAALEGCNAKMNNESVKVGFIGSVKQLTIKRHATLGEVLKTNVKIVNNALGVNIAEGVVMCGQEELAKCVLNIFLKPD